MSWQPNGRYYNFTAEVIRACVPEASGVYGLFNFRRQLFIGEAENMQAALLRHLSGRKSEPWRFRATRFSFQVCAEDLRKQRAAELIQRYQPARQNQAALSEAAPPAGDAAPSASPSVDLDHASIDLEEFSMHEREAPPAQPRFYFERAQGTMLLALFAVCMTVSFYLGLLAGESRQRHANRAAETALASLTKQQVAVDLSEPPAAVNEAAGDVSVQIPGWMPTGIEPALSTAPSSAAAAAGVQRAGTTVAGADTSKKWSVQIAAAPARDDADVLAEQLTSAGFESYVVEAQVKGQTFYRVRVGPLDAEEKAESVRQALARQARYRDAFLVIE